MVICIQLLERISEKQVRVGSDVLVAELREGMKRARGHLCSVARIAAHLIEHLLTAEGFGGLKVASGSM